MKVCECERSEYLMLLRLSSEDAAAPRRERRSW